MLLNALMLSTVLLMMSTITTFAGVMVKSHTRRSMDRFIRLSAIVSMVSVVLIFLFWTAMSNFVHVN